MKKIILTALLAIFAVPAVASDFYAGVKLGPTNYGYTNVTNNDQAGWGVFGGFQITRIFLRKLNTPAWVDSTRSAGCTKVLPSV